MTTPFDNQPHQNSQSTVPMNAFKQDIENRFNQSLTNHMYVFPKHLSCESSLNTSLKSLDEAKSYNLHSQNAKRNCVPENTRPSSQESLLEESGQIIPQELKSKEGTLIFDEVKAEMNTLEKKVLSLGKEDLMNLYKKTMVTYQDTVKDEQNQSKEGKQNTSGVKGENGSVAKTVVMKIIKERDIKKKESNPYGIQQKVTTENRDKKMHISQRKEEKPNDASKERSKSKYAMQIKEFVKFSKEFGKLLKGKVTRDNSEQKTTLKEDISYKSVPIKKEELINNNPSTQKVVLDTDESIIEQKQPDTKKPISGYCGDLKQNLQRVANISENKDKEKEKKLEHKTSPATKKINLYMCYRSSAM